MMTITVVSLVAASVLGVPQKPHDVPSPIAVRSQPIQTAAIEPLTYREPRRPASLPVLYGTYVTLQALDVYTTGRAIAAGARETNPAVAPLTRDNLRLVAVKAVTTAGTIYCADRLWRRSRMGAVIVMAALNGASAWVVAHNARIARHLRHEVRP